MKIISWNINSVRLRLKLIQQLNDLYSPDIICLQETKVQDHLFPANDIRKIGYEYLVYHGEKSYNGVAILSKIPFDLNFTLPFCPFQSKRHLAVKIKDIELHNFYVPSGGDIPDVKLNPKFKHKLDFLASIQNWFIKNRTHNHKIILVGDLNIAPHEHDVWSSRHLRNEVSHSDIERKLLLEFQHSLNFIDSARHFIPLNEKFYTWWSYRNIDWQKSNRGRRLDHIWVSNNLKNNMVRVESLKEARNWLLPSDHVPYCLDIIY